MGLIKSTEPGGGFIREDGHHIPIIIDATAVDAGHTGYTTHLRKGLAMGKVTATGQYKQYAAGAGDGTETCVGYLYSDVDMVAGEAAAADRAGVLLVTGVVDNSKVIGSDAAAITDLAGKIWHV